MQIHLTLLSCLAALVAPAVAQSAIRWTPSFDAALAAAKEGNKVVLVAFNLAGERANDELVDDHYKDPTLAKLSQHTVNVFCSISAEARVPGVSPAQQQAAERQARLQVLKIGPGEDVIAPQHVFLGPDGAVLSAVAWRVTKGELEWAWVDAIRKIDPKFEWQLSEAARAPARLGFGNVERGRNQLPPTKAQVADALKELKKSRGGFLRNVELIGTLMRSDEPEAMAYVQNALGTARQFGSLKVSIDTIGMVSPKPYHTMVGGFLGEREDELRLAAAAALEHLAEPKALPALQKQYKAEKQENVRGRLLRAMASSAPANKDVIAAIEKVLAKEASPDLRAQALLALALVEDKDKVHAGLRQALRDGSAKVRATAAYALASRRDAEFALVLEEAAAREEDEETKAWIAEAAKVVRGGDAAAFRNFPEKVLGEDPVRAGLRRFGEGGGAGGGLPGGGAGGGRGGD